MPSASRTLPSAFVGKLRRIYPGRDGEEALAAFEKPRPCSFRVNPLKSEARALRVGIEEQGFKLEPLPWPPGAFLLRNRRQRDLEGTREYLEGRLYVQNPSSMAPPHLLAPQPGEAVLDLCAAPGGKTTLLAGLMRGEGRLEAFEEDLVRAEKLKATVSRQGAALVQVEVGDGAVLARKRGPVFDRVLLDAPCSAEGRFQSQEPSSFKYWREGTPAKAAKLQRRLFRGAMDALKIGGRLLYSTCAISPEENEGVAAWALETYGEGLEALGIGPLPPNARGALGAWDGMAYPSGVKRGVRFLPTQVFEGFYCALFRKK